MKKWLFGTEPVWSDALFLLRVWVGVIFVYHGLSIWDQNNMREFAAILQRENIPFPVLGAWLCKVSEFAGGVFLITGFAQRLACVFLIIDMAVATFVFGKGHLLQDGRTPFILLLCCLVIFLSAPDKLSASRLIFKKAKQ